MTFMISELKITPFQKILLRWYNKNARDFLWRDPRANSYTIIISEILLQRTKAQSVSKFLPKFLDVYPSWEKLSNATKNEVQEILRPIGLYNQKGGRLFNLAQKINENGGKLPNTRDEIIKLPMIGQYIGNAYELFILKTPSPLLDVNMARVLERYFGPRKLSDIRYDPYLQNLANKVVDHPQSINLNWAILDFAAMVCRKLNPKCNECPLAANCFYLYN